MLIELIKGVSLLLALAYLQTFNKRLWGRWTLPGDVASGVLFGAICVIGMNIPIVLTPGVIFDARSVIVSMAGLFGGPLVALVAGSIAVAYRITLGGGGMHVGIAVVVSSALFGLAYRYARQRGWFGVAFWQLAVFGFALHAWVVYVFTFLPPSTVERVMDELAIPFVLTFTAATGLLGWLLRDIEIRFATEQALRDSEAQLSRHLQNTPLAAISWDREFRTTQWNKAAEMIFGYTVDEAIGRTAADLIIPSGIESDVNSVFASLLTDKGGTRYTNENRTKDGRTIVCEWYNTPIRNRDGAMIGVTSLALDVTDRQQSQRDLQHALMAAEDANQAKSDFLARLSHEFRTPLNAIIGFSEVLQLRYFGPLGNEKYDEYARAIHESGEHLLALINDVLDISAIEAGKRPLVKEPVDIVDVIVESLEIVRVAAKYRQIELGLSIQENPTTLYADRRAVKQIMLNLLSNGVKFSTTGGAVITTVAANGDVMTISVADNGVGIAPDVLPTVTEVFTRGNTNVHLAQEGSGLGLSIVKSLVEAHDGVLEIESEVGKGTTVRVTLPLRVVQSPQDS